MWSPWGHWKVPWFEHAWRCWRKIVTDFESVLSFTSGICSFSPCCLWGKGQESLDLLMHLSPDIRLALGWKISTWILGNPSFWWTVEGLDYGCQPVELGWCSVVFHSSENMIIRGCKSSSWWAIKLALHWLSTFRVFPSECFLTIAQLWHTSRRDKKACWSQRSRPTLVLGSFLHSSSLHHAHSQPPAAEIRRMDSSLGVHRDFSVLGDARFGSLGAQI